MPRGLLLDGPVGSGKTTVLLELDELLAERPEPYALLDLDWLAWARAPRATPAELLAANLAAVWRTFRTAGVDRLALTRMLTSAEELTAIRAAVPDVDLRVVRLDVPRGVLEARLHARDSEGELAEHLRLLDAPPVDADAVVSADRSPREVACDVLAAAGW